VVPLEQMARHLVACSGVVQAPRLVVQLAPLGLELALRVRNTKEVIQIPPVDGAPEVAVEDTMVAVQEVGSVEIMAQEAAAQALPPTPSAATNRRLCRLALHLGLPLLPQVLTAAVVKQHRMVLLSLPHTQQKPRPHISITQALIRPSAQVAPRVSECNCGGLVGVLDSTWLVELVGMLTLPLQFHLAHHRSRSL